MILPHHPTENDIYKHFANYVKERCLYDLRHDKPRTWIDVMMYCKDHNIIFDLEHDLVKSIELQQSTKSVKHEKGDENTDDLDHSVRPLNRTIITEAYSVAYMKKLSCKLVKELKTKGKFPGNCKCFFAEIPIFKYNEETGEEECERMNKQLCIEIEYVKSRNTMCQLF
jgi:hypothetical protein